MIQVYPEMKQLDHAACKGGIPYYTFLCDEGAQALRLYLEDRKQRYGGISDEDPLFCGEYNQLPREERRRKIITSRELEIILKQAARRAGMPEWRLVHPHALRKSYEKILRTQLIDGRVFHFGGIELRRHDYPIFLKRFQQRLLDILLDAETAAEITRTQVGKAVECVQTTLEEVLSGNLLLNELAISKTLRMPIERYRSMFPNVLAATQLRKKQKTVKPGDLVDYVYVDNDHVNPMNRVAPAQFAETYDADKYAEMLLDVAETVLGVFGFSRTQLEFQHKARSFLDELRGERGRKILLELQSLEEDAKRRS